MQVEFESLKPREAYVSEQGTLTAEPALPILITAGGKKSNPLSLSNYSNNLQQLMWNEMQVSSIGFHPAILTASEKSLKSPGGGNSNYLHSGS